MFYRIIISCAIGQRDELYRLLFAISEDRDKWKIDFDEPNPAKPYQIIMETSRFEEIKSIAYSILDFDEMKESNGIISRHANGRRGTMIDIEKIHEGFLTNIGEYMPSNSYRRGRLAAIIDRLSDI